MRSDKWKHVAFAGDLYDESAREYKNVEHEEDAVEDVAWPAYEDDINARRLEDESYPPATGEESPRKRVTIRVPVVRSRSARQHRLTVVRRRPVTSRTQDIADEADATSAPRRIVVTRVRTLGKSAYPTDVAEPIGDYPSTVGRHKVTITRRRKLQSVAPTPSSSIPNKVRVTRKKLVAVRPVQPTPTFAIITTGFFTASSEYNEYSDEEEREDDVIGDKDRVAVTPRLEETPNVIDNKPSEEASLPEPLESSSTVSQEDAPVTPVIITDNFFFPDDERDEEYDYLERTTTTESVDKITILTNDEEHSTTISPKSEDNKSKDAETENDDAAATPIDQLDTTESTDATSEDTGTKTPDIPDRDATTTEYAFTERDIDDKSTTREHTTVAGVDEQTTFAPDRSEFTEESAIPDTTETPEDSAERGASPETPIRPHVKVESAATIAPSVIPLQTARSSTRDADTTTNYLDDSYIPSVIPLGASYTRATETTKIASPTPEEIEAGLADDLYLSLSRLDFPEILPSKSATLGRDKTKFTTPELEPSTSVYYTETVVTSTRLRTYTYVVTQQNGLETKVTSSTTVRPRVTTLTLTVPVTVTVTPTVESSADVVSSVYNPVPVAGE